MSEQDLIFIQEEDEEPMEIGGAAAAPERRTPEKRKIEAIFDDDDEKDENEGEEDEEEQRLAKRSRVREEELEEEVQEFVYEDLFRGEEEVEEQDFAGLRDDDEDKEGEVQGEEDEERPLVAEIKASERTSTILSAATDYREKFDIAAKDCQDSGIVSNQVIEVIKHHVFDSSHAAELQINYKNPIGLILGYIMYRKINLHRMSQVQAFMETKEYIGSLFTTAREKKAEQERTTITDVDVIRYYSFWNEVVFQKKN